MEYDPPSPDTVDESPSPPSPPAEPQRRWRDRPWIKWGVPVVAAVAIGVVGGIAFASVIRMPRVRTVADYTPSLITEIRDRRGEVFASYSRERRIMLEEGEAIPTVLTEALIASEDQNFYQHGGVDPLAIVRAQLANIKAGRITEGASTITMQLARELFLTRERTWSRKIEEALLAVELEKNFTKEQILTLYLNLVNVGHGNYGMAAAARDYFDKTVHELTVPEAATLVAILPSPSRYNPYRRPELVRQLRDSVLRRMRDAEFITEAAYEEARRSPLELVGDRRTEYLAPYFSEEVRKYLDAAYGTAAVVEGGLQVATTLDPAIQRAAEDSLRAGLLELDHGKGWRGPIDHLDEEELETAELPTWTGSTPIAGRWYQGLILEAGAREARVQIDGTVYPLTGEGMEWTGRGRPSSLLERGDVAWFRVEASEPDAGEGNGAVEIFLEQEPELEGAALVIESATGAVRAMVGGWSYRRSKFNRAVQAHRQVGSAFKPFVFGAALEMGYTPADTLFDAPTQFVGSTREPSYQPRNYKRSYHGITTLRRALEHSINITSVKLLDLVGIERVVEFAHTCGVDSELPPYPSLALGTAELTPLELAAAYATIANQGTYVEPYLIEQVTDPDGDLLEEHLPNTRSATDPRIAYVLTHMLEGVVDRGTGTRLKGLDIDLAGKTGTTDDYSDAWFVGFTPRHTLLAWVGYDVTRTIGRRMTGARAALPIWKGIAERGLEEGWLEPGSRFTVPPGVILRPVEYTTGLLPGPGAEQVIQEAFVEGTEPVREYTPRWDRIMRLAWYQQQAFYIPKEGENMPPEVWYEQETDEAVAEVPETDETPGG